MSQNDPYAITYTVEWACLSINIVGTHQLPSIGGQVNIFNLFFFFFNKITHSFVIYRTKTLHSYKMHVDSLKLVKTVL